MDRDKMWIVDHLISYWSGGLTAADAESWRICRQVVAELAASMPALELLEWQEAPHQHRRQIEERVASWLAARTASRDIVNGATKAALPRPPTPTLSTAVQARGPAPIPAAAPRSAGSRIDQHVQGGVAIGKVHSLQGGINLTLPGSDAASGGERPPARAGAAAADRTLRILFLGANPADSTRLRLDEEVREIDHALASAELGHRCELCQRWAVRVSDLQGYLLRTKPGVLHFSGHGGRESAVVLEADDGSSRPVAAIRLANLLKQFNERLRCVVLNACYSAEQAAAIAEHVDCVVGMSTAVADRAAIRFAAAFYLAVASGCNVRASFDQACADVEVGELGQDEVPTLVARRCDPAKLILVGPG